MHTQIRTFRVGVTFGGSWTTVCVLTLSYAGSLYLVSFSQRKTTFININVWCCALFMVLETEPKNLFNRKKNHRQVGTKKHYNSMNMGFF